MMDGIEGIEDTIGEVGYTLGDLNELLNNIDTRVSSAKGIRTRLESLDQPVWLTPEPIKLVDGFSDGFSDCLAVREPEFLENIKKNKYQEHNMVDKCIMKSVCVGEVPRKIPSIYERLCKEYL